MKVEDKLGLSWAKLSRRTKLSHPNSIELRLTAVSRISCSFEEPNRIGMLQKCVFSTSEVQEGKVERNHIVDF